MDDKWLILGQEMKLAWAREGGTSSALWEPDLTTHGSGIFWRISCGYFGASADRVARVPWHSLAGEDLGYIDISLKIFKAGV